MARVRESLVFMISSVGVTSNRGALGGSPHTESIRSASPHDHGTVARLLSTTHRPRWLHIGASLNPPSPLRSSTCLCSSRTCITTSDDAPSGPDTRPAWSARPPSPPPPWVMPPAKPLTPQRSAPPPHPLPRLHAVDQLTAAVDSPPHRKLCLHTQQLNECVAGVIRAIRKSQTEKPDRDRNPPRERQRLADMCCEQPSTVTEKGQLSLSPHTTDAFRKPGLV